MRICTFSFMEKGHSERKLGSLWKKKKGKLEEPRKQFKTKPHSFENKHIK